MLLLLTSAATAFLIRFKIEYQRTPEHLRFAVLWRWVWEKE